MKLFGLLIGTFCSVNAFRACPMIHMPVCGVDGLTYGNFGI